MNLSLLLCSHLLLILKNVSLSEFSSCDSADTNSKLVAIVKNTPEAAYDMCEFIRWIYIVDSRAKRLTYDKKKPVEVLK